MLSISVEQIESLLKLWDLFVSQVENARSTGWSSETDLALRLGNWGLGRIEEVLTVINLQDGHYDGFKVGWGYLLSLHLGDVGLVKLFHGRLVLVIDLGRQFTVNSGCDELP